MAAMIAVGVASSGALSALVAKTFRSGIEARTTIIPAGAKEKKDHGNQRN
ncbi:MAG TPA: hypothetical protein VHT28_13885 [Silvibacterium sp.]|jgi:hypothetical protein|nr:hypothetical protein [Silvibacterium sp.]